MNQVVTLTGFEEKKRGESKYGPWALRLFTAAGGTKFQTFDVELGDQLIGLVGQPVEVEYEVEERDGYQNNVLKGVREVTTAEVTTAPLVSNRFSENDSERQLRIMRQSGLDRAINTVKAGIVEVDGVTDLFRLSDAYIDYFENGVPVEEPVQY